MRLKLLVVAAALLYCLPAQAQSIHACKVLRDPDGYPMILAAASAGEQAKVVANIYLDPSEKTPAVSKATFVRLADTRTYAWYPAKNDALVRAAFKGTSYVRLAMGSTSSPCSLSAFKSGERIVSAPRVRPADKFCPDCVRQLACKVFPQVFAFPVSSPVCGGWSFHVSTVVVNKTIGDELSEPPYGAGFSFEVKCLLIGDQEKHTIVLASIPVGFSSSDLEFSNPGQPVHPVLLQQTQQHTHMYYWIPSDIQPEEPISSEMFEFPSLTKLYLDGAHVADCEYLAYRVTNIIHDLVQPGIHNVASHVSDIDGKNGCPNCIQQVACSTLQNTYGEQQLTPNFSCDVSSWKLFTDYDLAKEIEDVIDFIDAVP